MFLSFLGMVMYANEVERKEKYKLPEIIKITTTHIYQDCREDKILHVWLRLFANGLQRLQGTHKKTTF